MSAHVKAFRGSCGLGAAVALTFGFLGLEMVGAYGAAPTLTGIAPAGLNPGESVAVKFSGKLEGSQRRVWTDDPGLVFTVPDGSGNAWVRVDPAVRPGVHLVRLVNAEGVSEVARLMVGPLPRLEEKEPNDEVAAPQKIQKLPVWIQGQLERHGDVDGYGLSLKKGVPVFIRADAYELGSEVDLHFHLVNAEGERLASATNARHLDPRMVYVPEKDGEVVLQVAGFAHPPVADVNFAGATKCRYLIAVSDQPVATRVFPAVVSKQGGVEAVLRGPGLKPEASKVKLERDSVFGTRELGFVAPKGAVMPLSVLHTPFPVGTGKPAGDGGAPFLEPPVVVGGELLDATKPSEWRVTMKKGQKLQARLWSRSLGLGAEGEVTVWSPAGQVVASTPSPADVFLEPVVPWTAAVDGDYRVVVRDLFGRAREGMEFVLEIAAPEATCTAELVVVKPATFPAVRVPAGQTGAQKVKVTLGGGWKEPVVLRVGGLPEGVSAAEVGVPEKGGEVEVTLQAAENAPISTTLAHVSIWTKNAPFRFIPAQFALRGDLQRGASDSDWASEFWVSVVPKPVEKAKEGGQK